MLHCWCLRGNCIIGLELCSAWEAWEAMHAKQDHHLDFLREPFCLELAVCQLLLQLLHCLLSASASWAVCASAATAAESCTASALWMWM